MTEPTNACPSQDRPGEERVPATRFAGQPAVGRRREILLREARVAFDRSIGWLALLPQADREAEIEAQVARLRALR